MLWLIRGAQRGVGKTHLATRLCAVLPNAVYAKLGHGARQAHKPANYFTTTDELTTFIASQHRRSHLVLEAQSFAAPATSLTLFIDAFPSSTRRDDAAELAARADIIVRIGEPPGNWQHVLMRRLRTPALVEAVMDVLLEQQQRLAPRLSIRSKVWLINEQGEHVFGSGLASLLDDIRHLGSLKAAAEQAGMSYRHAWGALRAMEQHIGQKLVQPSVGGTGGGGSCLTAAGEHVLAAYQQIERSVARTADEKFCKLYPTLLREQEQD